jgi:large subunit ribosomal protein L28
MSRVCYFTGKRTSAGRSIKRRGKANYLGGVGRKVTGSTKRKFKPNIQKVRAVIDGGVRRVKASAKAIRIGLVQKPPKRNYTSADSTLRPRSGQAGSPPAEEHKSASA